METHVVEIIREKGDARGALKVEDISAVNGVNAYKLGECLSFDLLVVCVTDTHFSYVIVWLFALTE